MLHCPVEKTLCRTLHCCSHSLLCLRAAQVAPVTIQSHQLSRSRRELSSCVESFFSFFLSFSNCILSRFQRPSTINKRGRRPSQFANQQQDQISDCRKSPTCTCQLTTPSPSSSSSSSNPEPSSSTHSSASSKPTRYPSLCRRHNIHNVNLSAPRPPEHQISSLAASAYTASRTQPLSSGPLRSPRLPRRQLSSHRS